MARCLRPFSICFALIPVVLIALTAANASAELKSLSDAELSAVYAEGFSDFTITDLGSSLTETKAWFNIEAYTYTEIDSLKLGYHDLYTPGTKQWDQDWVNVQLGTDYEDPTGDLHASGFYFKAEFTNIDNPSTRELKSITFGVEDLTGPISANFNSFSGTIDDSDNGTPEFYGHAMALGSRTITAGDHNGDGDASEFSITLSVDPAQQGYWVNFSEAIVTP